LLSLDRYPPAYKPTAVRRLWPFFEEKEPSVIVFDYHLGDDTGLEIFQDLVQRKAKPFLAFMLTAMDAKEVKKGRLSRRASSSSLKNLSTRWNSGG
jgi:CheY-like chemotaxis protein